MQQYLGICMVVITVSLCIGILSMIVSENIWKQYEAHKDRAMEKFTKRLLGALEGSTKYVGKYIEYSKEVIELDKKYSDRKDLATEAFKKTMNEIYDDVKS